MITGRIKSLLWSRHKITALLSRTHQYFYQCPEVHRKIIAKLSTAPSKFSIPSLNKSSNDNPLSVHLRDLSMIFSLSALDQPAKNWKTEDPVSSFWWCSLTVTILFAVDLLLDWLLENISLFWDFSLSRETNRIPLFFRIKNPSSWRSHW